VVNYKGDNNNDYGREQDHVQEQTTALKALYLSSSSSLDEEKTDVVSDKNDTKNGKLLRFVVKRDSKF